MSAPLGPQLPSIVHQPVGSPGGDAPKDAAGTTNAISLSLEEIHRDIEFSSDPEGTSRVVKNGMTMGQVVDAVIDNVRTELKTPKADYSVAKIKGVFGRDPPGSDTIAAAPYTKKNGQTYFKFDITWHIQLKDSNGQELVGDDGKPKVVKITQSIYTTVKVPADTKDLNAMNAAMQHSYRLAKSYELVAKLAYNPSSAASNELKQLRDQLKSNNYMSFKAAKDQANAANTLADHKFVAQIGTLNRPLDLSVDSKITEKTQRLLSGNAAIPATISRIEKMHLQKFNFVSGSKFERMERNGKIEGNLGDIEKKEFIANLEEKNVQYQKEFDEISGTLDSQAVLKALGNESCKKLRQTLAELTEEKPLNTQDRRLWNKGLEEARDKIYEDVGLHEFEEKVTQLQRLYRNMSSNYGLLKELKLDQDELDKIDYDLSAKESYISECQRLRGKVDEIIDDGKVSDADEVELSDVDEVELSDADEVESSVSETSSDGYPSGIESDSDDETSSLLAEDLRDEMDVDENSPEDGKKKVLTGSITNNAPDFESINDAIDLVQVPLTGIPGGAEINLTFLFLMQVDTKVLVETMSYEALEPNYDSVTKVHLTENNRGWDEALLQRLPALSLLAAKQSEGRPGVNNPLLIRGEGVQVKQENALFPANYGVLAMEPKENLLDLFNASYSAFEAIVKADKAANRKTVIEVGRDLGGATPKDLTYILAAQYLAAKQAGVKEFRIYLGNASQRDQYLAENIPGSIDETLRVSIAVKKLFSMTLSDLLEIIDNNIKEAESRAKKLS